MPKRMRLSSAAMKSTSGEPPFRFFDLPPELRNRVYNLVFAADTLVHIPDRKPSGLLLACKQSYHETISFYYDQTIYATSIDHLAIWLFAIGQARRDQVKMYGYNTFKPFESDSLSQERLRLQAAHLQHAREDVLGSLQNHKLVTKEDEEKVKVGFVFPTFPGSMTYWTSNPKETARQLIKCMKDVKKDKTESLRRERVWWLMLWEFGIVSD